MEANKRILGGLLITVAIASFSCMTGNKKNTQSGDILNNCPVVAQYVQVGDDKVMVCDQKLFADTIRLPLSFFTEEMQIIKLDNRDEALVGQTAITASENYLLAHSGYPPKPFKLFDKTGKFLTEIGSIGQGPGEYQSVYDAQLDEANDRIYLMPWQSQKLLVYDLKGKSLDPIPLCLRCPKAKFRVDTQAGTVAVVLLPFKGIPAVAWTQDLKGNRLNYIEPGYLEAPMDFSNEVTSGKNIPGVFDVNILCIAPTRVDSLYRYDTEKGRLQPTFTLKFPDADNIPWHNYSEWPDFFTGNTSAPPVEIEPGMLVGGETIHYIVDKQTCKGAYFKLFNDFFGNQEIGWPSGAFSNGYYINNIEPGNLLSNIETLLQEKDLTESMRKKLTDLQATIDENDNNYVFIARLKK